MARRHTRASLFRELTWADVQEWAGEKIAALGREDQQAQRVEEVRRAGDGSVLGWVRDRERYASWVKVARDQISTVCSCRPQGVCHHAVALALEYRDQLRRQQNVPQAGRGDPCLVLLEKLTGRELVARATPEPPDRPPPRPASGPLVLHAIWGTDSRLHLWAEDGARLPAAAGGPNNGNRTRPHPFACLQERLRQVLSLTGGAEAELPLQLPSGPSGPQPSPLLPWGGGRAGRLVSWMAPTLSLGPAEAAQFLLTWRGVPGLVAGDSVRFWVTAARLGLEALAAGRALPALLARGPGYQARWRLVSDAGTRRRLQLLEMAMPPLCRAAAPDLPPAALLEDMVESVLDGCARQLLNHRRLSSGLSQPQPATVAWLSALVAPDSAVGADSEDLAELQTALDTWGGATGPQGLRTCFRLVPPEGDPGGEDQPWQLEFLIQATDDPSLLVPASEAWEARGSAALVLGRALTRPQERLLADLGQAARLYPPLAAALQAARLAPLALDVQGAYEFLRRGVPLLQEAGFGILVPSWWGRPGGRLGAKLVLQSPERGPGGLGTAGLCAYRWEVALGEQTLTRQEFRQLAALKVPLLQVQGEWVELGGDEVQEALEFLEGRDQEGEMTVGEALRLSAGVDASPLGLPVTGVSAKGWLKELLAGLGEGRLKEAETPAGFKGDLRPYQQRGMAWMDFLGKIGLGACLADDMGLGKTIEMLALLVSERPNGDKPGPTLLVCPMSVVGNWQREAARFAPKLKVHVHHGGDRLTGDNFAKAAGKADMVVTTYGLATREQEMLASVTWHRIVLDEAQNIKNVAAAQTRAIRTLKAGQRVAMTGTPVENRLTELWSIMDFLNPGLLGTVSHFREHYALPIEKNQDGKKAELLRRVTGPFILRRLKTDRTIIKDLPEKIEIKTYCNLTREQATLYQALVDEMMKKIEDTEGIERKGHVLATMMKLKQVCNHPAHMLQDRSKLKGRSGKLARLEELLEEVLAEGDKALIFTQFAEWGKVLQPYLHQQLGKEILFLHGGSTRKARDEMVERFQDPQGPPLLLLSLKAGGTGLNLTAASHVIHFDRWWNPAVEDQATDRAFRIGQRRDVQVRKLVCVGTLEERIDQMIEQKKGLAQQIIGTGEAWLTELSTDKIREIVALSADAVGEE